MWLILNEENRKGQLKLTLSDRFAAMVLNQRDLHDLFHYVCCTMKRGCSLG